MSTFELAYLTMVVAAAVLFVGTLAWAAHRSH
jgi:hypothetical protein